MIVAPSFHEGDTKRPQLRRKNGREILSSEEEGWEQWVFAFGDEVFSKAYNYLLSDDAFSDMTEEEEGLYTIPLDMSSHSYSFTAPVCYMTFLYSPAAFKVFIWAVVAIMCGCFFCSSLLSWWVAFFFKLWQLFIVYLFFCPHPNIIALIWKPHLVIGVPMRSAGEEVEMTKQVQKW